MSSVRRIVSGLLGIAAAFTVSAADAQGNLDAGKSPAQIFSNTCSACHRTARELKRSSEGFLRSHYTTGREEASAMAGYLASVGSEPNPGQSKRGPATSDNPKSSRRESAATPDAQSSRRPSAQGDSKAGESKAQGRNAASNRRGRAEPEPRAPEPAAEPPPPPPPPPVLESFEE